MAIVDMIQVFLKNKDLKITVHIRRVTRNISGQEKFVKIRALR